MRVVCAQVFHGMNLGTFPQKRDKRIHRKGLAEKIALHLVDLEITESLIMEDIQGNISTAPLIRKADAVGADIRPGVQLEWYIQACSEGQSIPRSEPNACSASTRTERMTSRTPIVAATRARHGHSDVRISRAAPLSAKQSAVLSTIGANPGTTRVRGAPCSNQPKMTAPPSNTSRAPTIPESGMRFFSALGDTAPRNRPSVCPVPRESSDSLYP